METEQQIILKKKKIMEVLGFKFDEKENQFVHPDLPLGLSIEEIKQKNYEELIHFITIMKERFL